MPLYNAAIVSGDGDRKYQPFREVYNSFAAYFQVLQLALVIDGNHILTVLRTTAMMMFVSLFGTCRGCVGGGIDAVSALRALMKGIRVRAPRLCGPFLVMYLVLGW